MVEAELGRGGMGLVLLARRADTLYERTVAIKVIQSVLAREEFTRRFRHETRILARLQHPAIVTLLDAGTTDEDQPFLVMEYVDGEPIDVYAERNTLDLPHILDLLITLCDALAHAHSHGVIHRDIKPGNVLVSARGELKLLDFGIARLSAPDSQHPEQTVTQFRFATPTYASPEQIAGTSAISFRSDIYSVGVLAYVLFTGGPPFQLTGLSTAEMERLFQTSQPALPSRAARARFTGLLPSALDAVIGRAMEPVTEQRYETMEAFKAELQRLSKGDVTLAFSRRYLARRAWRAHREVVARSLVAASTVLLFGAGTLWLHRSHAVVPPVPMEHSRPSLAVVPVSDSGLEGFGSAAQEALSNELSSGDQVRIAPPEAVAQAMRDLGLKPSSRLLPQQRAQVARLLNVEYLLTENASAAQAPIGQGGAGSLRLVASLERFRGEQRLSEQPLDTTAGGLGEATQQMAVNVARLLPLKQTLAATPSLLPNQPKAVRLYAAGLEDLQSLEPVPAQVKLLQAAAVEPGSPLIHVALARAWDMLGYRGRAVDEADKAVTLSAGFPVRTRLAVQAPANEIRHQRPAAIAVYRTLRDYDPDNVDYVLGLAESQFAANQPQDALVTLRSASSMRSLLGADPRIELLVSKVQESLGKHTDALRSADAVYAASRERKATQLMAQAQAARASALESLSRVDEGLAAAQQAEDLFSAAGDIKGRGIMLVSTGNFLEDHAKYADAKSAYTEAKAIFAQVGDDQRLGVAENDLGIIAMDVGDAEEALKHYTEAMRMFQRVENTPSVASELNNIGLIQNELGHPEAAKASYIASLKLRERLHDTREVARVYTNLGSLLVQQNKLREAGQDYSKAYAIYSGEGQAANALKPLMGEAHLSWLTGKLAEAHADYQQAIEISQKLGQPKLLGAALRADAHVLHDAGMKRAHARS
ncbi:protein kinase domain-containing protein [Terriglobus aquaticus]|uniref:Protein kinase domain-containing protein n=1 Tax=Terriglobus aquaticus TaxID=940139 RepID=A0ABW9KGH6_9BACT|nr:protein kinase [Terriglobus aquaticus]